MAKIVCSLTIEVDLDAYERPDPCRCGLRKGEPDRFLGPTVAEFLAMDSGQLISFVFDKWEWGKFYEESSCGRPGHAARLPKEKYAVRYDGRIVSGWADPERSEPSGDVDVGHA